MSEKTVDVIGPVEVGGAGKAATEIAYCPHLQVYHYLRVDGVEHVFDQRDLERSIDGYLRNGNERQAEFMATLAGFAKQFPHQVVSFDEQGRLNLRELLARELEVDGAEAAPAGSPAAVLEVMEAVSADGEAKAPVDETKSTGGETRSPDGETKSTGDEARGSGDETK